MAEKKDRRDEILDAALACFLERGYLATSIADIRSESGASTGSIYHFFANKSALARALLDRAVAGWSAASIAALGDDVPAEKAIKAAVEGLVRWGLANPALLRFMDEIRTLAATDPGFVNVRDALVKGQAVGESRYRQFMRRGEVRSLPWPVAHSLILGPAYNFLRLATGGSAGARDAPPRLLADAAWEAVRAPYPKRLRSSE
jgi:AcrR family transcriptional regulator